MQGKRGRQPLNYELISFKIIFRYKEKELVTVIDEKTLKLKFEPSKRSTDPDHYYTKPKENRCVVCGTREELRRKNIVPIEYKRYFQGKSCI